MEHINYVRISICARLIELDPKYVDVVVRRQQEFSGSGLPVSPMR
jgi:hypothetical protein